MAIYRAPLSNGGQISFDSKEIGRGAEKAVFFATDQQNVVCFYLKSAFDQVNTRAKRVARLGDLLSKFNLTKAGVPNADFWTKHYCWPTTIINGNGDIPATFFTSNGLLSPALGIVVPKYKPQFLFTNAYGVPVEGDISWFVKDRLRRTLPDAHRGNFLQYCQVASKIARAVRKMHTAGLAHSDLSNRNVLIDPRSGDACIIDIDALVVPQFAPPTVLGTHGYIAPEVLSNKQINGQRALPCIATDQYALGVLIYELLLFRHPIERDRPVNASLTPEEDNLLAYGSEALFREHHTDTRNHWRVPTIVPLKRLGPYLYEQCMRLFVDGLHDRQKRPTAAAWEDALYKTMNLLHPTQEPTLNGYTASDFFVLAPMMPMQIPTTRKHLTQPVPYAKFHRIAQNGQELAETTPGKFVKSFHNSFTIWHMRNVHAWHARYGVAPDENCADRNPVGKFHYANNTWWLTNQSKSAFEHRGGGSNVPPGQQVKIEPGLRLKLDPSPQGRIFEFGFTNP